MKKFRLSKFMAVGAAALFCQQGYAAMNYGEALQKSIYFYEAQQSGVLPSWNRVEWRGNSTLDDGSDVNLDLSGGWYDAGDHVKFGFPMAASATMLAWGAIENPSAYELSGQMVHLKNNLRYVADYFVNAHPKPNEFYGQVGTGAPDHGWWGPAEVLHATTSAASTRPSYKIDATCPGSDLAGETAAALAAISMIFKTDDPVYSAKLLKHARELYTFGKTYQGAYSDCITDASGFYNSWSGFKDELVWSAIWLHQATEETAYLNDAKAAYANLGNEGQEPVKAYKWTQAWDDKSYGSYVLLAKITGEAEYKADAERWLDYWTTGVNGSRVAYSPGGLAQVDSWGATRYAANTSFIALVYSDYLKTLDPTNPRIATYHNFAKGQLGYILGDNPHNFSFQIGMTPNGPKNPHHRTAHGTWTDSLRAEGDNRHLLVGALVAGPGAPAKSEVGDDSYVDDRADYTENEVATDYNAGYTSALARMYMEYGGDPIPESQFPAKEVRDLEYYVDAKVNSTGPRFIEIGSVTYNHSAWPAKVNNDLKFRYWVDLSDEMAKGYTINDVTVSTAYSQATSVSALKPWGNPADNIYYTEASFAGVDIFPGGQSASKKEVQFRISLPSTSNAPEWSNVGDPSWDEYTASLKQAPKIALYAGDTLVWGSEPAPECGGTTGINCLPTAADVSVSTEFDTPANIVLSASDSDGTISSYTTSAPTSGTLTGTGANRVYTPNPGFVGSDSFTYTATDDANGVSTPATVSITVKEAIVPAVSIVSPAANTEVTVGKTFTLVYDFKHAASVRVLVDGVEQATGVTTSSVTLTAPSVTGAFTVDVITQDASGADLAAQATLMLSAVVEPVNTAPVASFATSTTGLSVSVDGSASTDADGDTLTYSWDFGDNSAAGSGVTANHTYAAAGTYTVGLIVNDGKADSVRVEKSVTVSVPSGGASCQHITSDEWGGGFVSTIRISNTGTTAVDGWSVSWAYPAGISIGNTWNATVTGTGPYTATNEVWNGKIEPGQFVEFGIQGTKADGVSLPAEVIVSGEACK